MNVNRLDLDDLEWPFRTVLYQYGTRAFPPSPAMTRSDMRIT